MDSAEARRILVHGTSGPEPCGLFIRCVAGILDFGVVVVVLFWLTVAVRGTNPQGEIELPLWATLVYVAWWFGYYALFEYLWNGQTPGKRVARIRVVMGSGTPITKEAALKRTLVRPVDMLPWVVPYALGVLWMLATGPKRRQRLGDKWAGTKVVPVDPPRRAPEG